VYVAVKGGQEAIEAAHRLLAEERRGDPQVPEISVVQIEEQLALAVDRVMGEASLYDRQLAALAIKQAWGDMIEAVFLLRAFRTTLPRLGSTLPIDIAAMTVRRRVSATFKDLPGGQILGATFDYTHRLLNVDLAQASGRTTGELAEARVGPEGHHGPTRRARLLWLASARDGAARAGGAHRSGAARR
jgi:alpha-D-ribose 1-methylphosphonate 5-triphosphate synthase subunit PhnI